MSRVRFTSIATPSVPAANKGEIFYSSTMSPASLSWQDENGKPVRLGGSWIAGATGAVGGGFAADTYMTGTKIDVGQAGAWRAGMIYRAAFDMVKTGAGTATPIIIVRMGILGTTGDAAIQTFTFAVGTAVIDTARFVVEVEFRSIGGGTSAVLAGFATCNHHLAATGMTTTGASGFAMLPAASAGFDSTTPRFIGLSFNGGASFVGTNVASNATLEF